MNNDVNSVAVSAGLKAALGYYRLVAEIGRGGMASVFLALFPNGDETTRKVVLKQLHPELAMDDDFRAMFEDEARLATRLHHPNVVETYDIYSDLELCVLVMEFLDGQTLSRIRQRARKVNNVPLSIHLRIIAEVLRGLHYVHELTDEDNRPLGIVHRDVTPSNVFVTYDGRVKMVDFGIAKAPSRIAETRMGVLKGKLAYMSPEAVRGESVDRRSDIFSVGVILWEAATGLRLWQDHDEVAVYRRLAMGDLPLEPPGAPAPHPDILRIAKRALSIDPYERYRTAEEMQLEIEGLLVRLGKLTGPPALSAYMESFFAVEREKFQKILDDAVARFPTKPVSKRRLLANELTDSYPALDPTEPPTTVSRPGGGTFRTTSYDVSLDKDEVPDFRPRRRSFVFGMAAAAVATTIALLARAPRVQDGSLLGTALRGVSEKSTSGAEPHAANREVAANTAVVPHRSAPAIDAKVSPEPVAPEDVPAQRISPADGLPQSIPSQAMLSQDIAPAEVTARRMAATAPAVVAEPLITTVFSAHPTEARFFLDGEPMSGNPVTLHRRPDDKRHLIRVEAPGYPTVARVIGLDRDMTREFDLVSGSPASPAAARVARPRETNAEPASLPKPRRGKRPLDREDPWGF
jgi:eukaryotic-like serine/threonine-protein kinase